MNSGNGCPYIHSWKYLKTHLMYAVLCYLFILFFYYMRLLFRLQLILREIIVDIYKSDYYWDQFTSMLIKFCPDFNPHKYLRDVYSSLIGDYYWDQFISMLMEFCLDFNPHKYLRDVYSSLMGKGEDWFHSINWEKKILTMFLWRFELLPSKLEGSSPGHSGSAE